MPPASLDDLLAAAFQKAVARRTVRGFGLGYKHSRDVGYGRRRKRCLKFLVARKRDNVSRNERIRNTVTVRGRNWPTDVEATGPRVYEQANASCWIQFRSGSTTRNGPPGSCGVFLREVQNRDRCYLLTAGHVVLRPDREDADCGDLGVIDGILAGRVACGASYLTGSAGFYDIGIFQVPPDLPQIKQEPQSRIERIVTHAELGRLWFGGDLISWSMHAYRAQVEAEFDAFYTGTSSFPVQGRGERKYAPTVLASRAKPGHFFQGGDSGSPIVLNGGTALVGLHFLGSTRNHAKIGYSLSAETAVDVAQSHLGKELELA